MPSLRPFAGLRYDAARLPDLSAVLCPPYDVIDPDARERLLAQSDVNAVRLELPARTPTSAQAGDYERAAVTLRKWLADGTLRRDERPLVYVYEQRFSDGGTEPRVARSFFVELELEEYVSGSGVRPHEKTMPGPREHRFQLLSAVRTHLSPVLFLYDDGAAGGASAALLDELTTRPPDQVGTGPDGVGQRLWAIDPALDGAARELVNLSATRPATIADGHHRYETALRYSGIDGAPGAARFVLALMYDAHSGGLGLSPWHRMVADVADPAAVLEAASSLYVCRAVGSADQLRAELSESADAGVLGMWTRAGGALLEVDRGLAEPHLPAQVTDQVRWLDVSVLSGTLSPMIGASEPELSTAGRLTYTHDAAEAIARVERGEADVSFLLRPTPIDQVISVAAAGEYMPPKSTHFGPKAATGLVFDPLF